MVGFFKQTIRDVPLEGTTVLLRADFNVPLEKGGAIKDDFRIRAALPTIQRLLEDGCKVVIISHLGRPDGRDDSLSLETVAGRLAKLLKREVRFVDDCIGDKVKMAVKKAPKTSVVVLENLRFYPEEEANDEVFAKKIAQSSGARYFVQDGFGVVHRAHSSTSAITLNLPSVAGFLLEKEYQTITSAMKSPKRPLVAVMGGAKVSDKIGVIDNLVAKADKIIIGGAMANTFLNYHGKSMGNSKFEIDQNEVIDGVYAAIATRIGDSDVNDFLVLPTDVAVAKKISKIATRQSVGVGSVSKDDIVLDIGDKSIEKMSQLVAEAGTVIWNGTLGMAEFANFAHGSARLALTLATNRDIESIIGGGDTADFVLNWDARAGGSFDHVSTGGGASLELMAGKKLPGIECLLDARRQISYTNKR